MVLVRFSVQNLLTASDWSCKTFPTAWNKKTAIINTPPFSVFYTLEHRDITAYDNEGNDSETQPNHGPHCPCS